MAGINVIVIIVTAISFVNGIVHGQNDVVINQNNCDMSSLKARITQCEDEYGAIIPLNDTRYIIPSYSSCNITCTEKGGIASGYKMCLDGTVTGPDGNCDAPKRLHQKTNHRVKRGWRRFVRRVGRFVRRVGRFFRRVARTIGNVVKGIVCIIFCRGPPRDTTKPVVICPADKRIRNDEYQVSAVVIWGTVIATDNKDGRIGARQTRGPKSGWRFSEGRTEVCYSATDRAGNSGSCCFNVDVYVVICPEPPAVANGAYQYHPTDRFIYGGKAWYNCYRGYEFDDPDHSVLKCIEKTQNTNKGKWDIAEPKCQKKECPILENIADGSFTCTDSFWFKSRCEYTCKEGYDVKQGQSRVRVCGYRGLWLAKEPECKDITKPRVKTCPSNIIAYTEKSKTHSTVTWLAPQYEDNSGAVKVVLVTTKGRGSEFSLGTHRVEYWGVDEAGNIGGTCKFTIVVKRLTCPTIYPLPKQQVTCMGGYGYGAECSVACYGGAALSGPSKTECVRAGTSPRVYWDWADTGGQSMCEGRPCPDLDVPNNGAMVCDAWFYGHVCKMFCNENYDFSRTTSDSAKALRVCKTDGLWTYDKVPGCVDYGAGKPKLVSAVHYFSGDCCDPDVQADISGRFVNMVNESTKYSSLCKLYDRCSMSNVNIRCGPSCDGRRKRSVDMDLTIEMELETDSVSGKSGYVSANTLLQEVFDDIEQMVQSVNLGVDTTFSSFDRGMLQMNCENGELFSYHSFGCVGCGFGMYYNQTTEDCDKCPLNTYQDQSAAKTCTQCPYGKQTEAVGVTSEYGCMDVCKPGWFSAKGFEPCTPCPLGGYSTDLASTGCLTCPPGQTTLFEASSEIDACVGFDLLFSDGEDSGFTEITRDLSVSQVTTMVFTYKLLLEAPVTSETRFLTVSHIGQDFIQLSLHDNHVTGHILGCVVDDLLLDVRISNWNSHMIQFSQTSDDVSILVYDALSDVQNTKTCDTNILSLTEGNVTFTLGKGLVGLITDFNVHSTDAPEISTQTTECSGTNGGDIIAWSGVPVETLENCVLVESTCDLADACESNPCGVHTCVDEVNTFICECNVGFTGDVCDVNIDDCLENSCDEGSTCVDEVNGYTCLCDVGTRGEFCEEEIVNGNWSDWSPYSQCSASCEGGEQYRTRSCTQPVPDPDGEPCEGNSTETQECNAEACPVCPPLNIPANGASHCEEDGDYKNCTVYCEDGYDFTYRPPDTIFCGAITGYEWSFAHDENPFKELPECEPIETPQKLVVNTQIRYVAEQEGICNDETILNINKKLNKNMKEVQCGEGYFCDIEEIQIKGCDPGKRSTDPPVIYITVKAEEEEDDGETTQTEDEVADAFANSVTSLREAALIIQQQVTSGEYNIQLGGTTYYVAGHTILDSVQCGPGMTYFQFYCVPCGRGTFQDADFACSRCPIGTYQDEMKQTTCKPCPVGWTTMGTGAKVDADCSVPYTTKNPPVVSDEYTTLVDEVDVDTVEEENNEGDTLNQLDPWLPIGIGCAVFIFAIVITVFLVWKHKCRGDKLDNAVNHDCDRPQTSLSQGGIGLQFKDTKVEEFKGVKDNTGGRRDRSDHHNRLSNKVYMPKPGACYMNPGYCSHENHEFQPERKVHPMYFSQNN